MLLACSLVRNFAKIEDSKTQTRIG